MTVCCYYENNNDDCLFFILSMLNLVVVFKMGETYFLYSEKGKRNMTELNLYKCVGKSKCLQHYLS